jgi:dsDNA-binding SOS-regulon protein
MDENGKAADSSKLAKLKEIAKEIKESWLRDCDKTEYMIELINILKEILTKESLEEYFSEDEKILPFFMDEFQQEVLGNILIQPKIYGENGVEMKLD